MVRMRASSRVADVRAIAARRLARLVVVAVIIVVGADVARQLGPFLLFLEGFQDGALDDLAASRVDRMRDVGVELDAPVHVAGGAVLIELRAAVVAEPGPEVVLAAAMRA